jgi:membrane protein
MSRRSGWPRRSPPRATVRRASPLRTLLERLARVARWLVEPLLRFNLIDRSLALGAQAFGALIPLLIVLQSAQPGSRSIAADLIERFDLEGDAADVVREVFAVASGQTTTTGLSVFVLVVSVLSFTRRLQRLYEETWEFEQRGLRGTGWGLAWIAFFALYGSLYPLLDGVVHGLAGVALSLAGVFALGLFTPYLLLGRRLPWRRLVPQGALTAVGLTALGIWSAIYMPRAIESSASAYGAIGVAFALLTWLWGYAIVLVVAAVYGSPQLRWPGSPGAGEGRPRPSG